MQERSCSHKEVLDTMQARTRWCKVQGARCKGGDGWKFFPTMRASVLTVTKQRNMVQGGSIVWSRDSASSESGTATNEHTPASLHSLPIICLTPCVSGHPPFHFLVQATCTVPAVDVKAAVPKLLCNSPVMIWQLPTMLSG